MWWAYIGKRVGLTTIKSEKKRGQDNSESSPLSSEVVGVQFLCILPVISNNINIICNLVMESANCDHTIVK